MENRSFPLFRWLCWNDLQKLRSGTGRDCHDHAGVVLEGLLPVGFAPPVTIRGEQAVSSVSGSLKPFMAGWNALAQVRQCDGRTNR